MKKLAAKLKSIEGVVLLFFVVRLFGILNPPLETWHSWRQTLTNMMARNMSEGSFSMLYPTVDMAGGRSGIIGSEFPFFQSLIAGCNLVFGPEHWYGRLINLAVCSFAAWCFFQLCKRWWNERAAWYSAVIFLCSLWFAFSRKSMPDTFSVALVISGIYFLQRYLDGTKWRFLFFGAVLITLGGLCKIPAVFLFGLIVPLWMSRKVRFHSKLHITIVTAFSSAVILAWYFLWVPHLVETYGFQLYFPKGIAEGWGEIKPLLNDFLAQFYFGALRSYIVLLPLLLGIIWLFYRTNRVTMVGVAVLTFIFLVFSVKTGAVFPTHNYYVLPFVPVMAVIAGIGLQRLEPKYALFLLILVAGEGIGNQVSDFRIKDDVKYKLTLESQLNSLLPRGEKIVIPAGPDPQWMYWYHRKGWSVEPADLENSGLMSVIRSDGGKFFVIDKREQEPAPGFTKKGETKDLALYEIP